MDEIFSVEDEYWEYLFAISEDIISVQEQMEQTGTVSSFKENRNHEI